MGEYPEFATETEFDRWLEAEQDAAHAAGQTASAEPDIVEPTADQRAIWNIMKAFPAGLP